MNKRVFFSVIVLSSILFLSFPLHAAPVNYTFEVTMPGSTSFSGTINSNVIPGSYLYDQGFLNLDTVYYTIQVDFDADGTYTRANGSGFTYPDNPPDVDYFYADLISGPIANGGGVSGTQVQEFNYGNTNSVNAPTSQLKVGSGDSWLAFSRISDWSIDPTANIGLAMNTYDSNGNLDSNILINNVNIVDISPVPVPAAVWLLGTGLIAIVGYRRKFRS